MVASATVFGEVNGLPDPQDGFAFVVSGMVGSALTGSGRADVFMPGTGPNDGARRNEAGHITGVTRLVAVS
jgi:membrane-bound lytic murein transglycosylase